MISGRSVLLAITLVFALTGCTGELSDQIESLTLTTNSLQQQVEELKAESAAKSETLTLATDSLRQQVEELKVESAAKSETLTLATNSLQQQVEELKGESAAKSETLEALRKQIEHSAETSVTVSGRYELSDVEAIGFKAEKDKTALNQLSAGFIGSLFQKEDMSEGLLEFWEGSFPVAGEPPRVGIYLYDKNVEGKFGMMKGLASILGNPHIAVGNIIVECDSQKVCDFIVDALKSDSSSDRGMAPPTTTHQTEPPVSTTDSAIELNIAQLSQAYAKDRASADGKYKGKTVLARGKVKKAFTKANRVEVELYEFDVTEKTVVCKLNIGQQEAISNLLSSKEIIIKGKVLGVPGFSNVVIDPCSIHDLFK